MSVPHVLEQFKLTIKPNINTEEMCNKDVHPITQETITKYKKLANDPLLQEVWTKAMAKELGHLSQRFRYTKGVDITSVSYHSTKSRASPQISQLHMHT